MDDEEMMGLEGYVDDYIKRNGGGDRGMHMEKMETNECVAGCVEKQTNTLQRYLYYSFTLKPTKSKT